MLTCAQTHIQTHVHTHIPNKVSLMAGEVAQRLRALVALSEYLGSVPDTHILSHNHSQYSFRESNVLF